VDVPEARPCNASPSHPTTSSPPIQPLIASKGYVNCAEGVRNLIRMGLVWERLITPDLAAPPAWYVADVSCVYDHHEQTVTSHVLDLQHDHHDLVITNLHTHLDHGHCLGMPRPSAFATA
jgi:metal-responsive CopG/Arc/MetJ family transcriptional regulator